MTYMRTHDKSEDHWCNSLFILSPYLAPSLYLIFNINCSFHHLNFFQQFTLSTFSFLYVNCLNSFKRSVMSNFFTSCCSWWRKFCNLVSLCFFHYIIVHLKIQARQGPHNGFVFISCINIIVRK
jgi:hypothetical protein